MVLNRRDLERAFSPHRHRRSLGQRNSLNKSLKGGSAVTHTSSNMKVVVRIRPQNAKELENNCRYDYCRISGFVPEMYCSFYVLS